MANTKIANLRGPTGAQGAQGNPGATGATGTAATIAVGTTTTGAPGTNASVTNSGTANAATFNFTIPQGVVGPTGSTGSQGPQGVAGPTGATGAPGENANTTTSAAFTIPTVGQTVTVTVADAGWIVVGQMLYVDQAGGGPGQAGVLQVTAKSGNQLTLLNPVPAPAIPLASSSTSGLLTMVSGNSTDFVDGTNTCQNLVTAVQPTIWSARLRSFNAIGNPTFEVDQRNVGNLVIPPAGTSLVIDRWATMKPAATTLALNIGQIGPQNPGTVPGTNFRISSKQFGGSVTTQQATLAAGDFYGITQTIEGCNFRELMSDVSSLSFLIYCSVANLTFAIALRDVPATQSYVRLFTIPTAATWTLIQLPNIPIFPSSGNFSMLSGVAGYQLTITLACGSTFQAPATNVWQSGNFLGAAGMSNIGAQATSIYFGFVQHEPGAVCSTPIDCPFTQNYDDCLRYYSKTYNYGVAAGTVGYAGTNGSFAGISTTGANGFGVFSKRMAKAPTVTCYNPATGTNNTCIDGVTAGSLSATASFIGDNAFYQVTGTGYTAGHSVGVQYTADTGW